MLVTSEMLLKAAEEDREWPAEIPTETGVFVTPEQLRTAARLVSEGEETRIDYPVRLRTRAERPAFIEAGQQEDPNVLTLIIGIFGTEKHHIAPDGGVVCV